MSNSWRMGWIAGLVVLAGGTVANAQGSGTAAGPPDGGTAAGAQVGGTIAGAPTGGSSNLGGRVSAPARGDDESDEPKETMIPPPPRSRMSSFNRLKTMRREVVPAPTPASRGARPGGNSAGAGMRAQADPLRPYSAQTMPARPQASGSSWQGPRRPAGPRMMVRSRTHSYYPGMRPEQHPNANTAPIARTRPGRGRTPAALMPGPGGGMLGLGGGMLGLGGGMLGPGAGTTANSATAARSGPLSPPSSSGPSPAGAARR